MTRNMTVENEKKDLTRFLAHLITIQTHLKISCYFVGGCVRDRLLGRESHDYDLAVDGDLSALIKMLHKNYRLTPSILDTAKLRFGHYHVDLAAFRRERYLSNNGLPVVESGDIESDLNRRDFTINTGYILLTHENLDKMLHVREIELSYAHPNFNEDIQNGVLRVLHNGSFIEDPSRMLRAVKYATLYALKMEATTQSLFREALDKKVLEDYSRDRYRQLILDFAKLSQGVQILKNLFDAELLLNLNRADTERIRTYDKHFEDMSQSAAHQVGILYLLLLYEYQLDFWIGANRNISETAKACYTLQELDSSTDAQHWQSRWWGYETFKRFDPITLRFAALAVSIPEAVKAALRVYNEETQSIKLGINGNTLKSMGVENGKIIGALLNLLLVYKVETGLDMTLEEEIKWIERKRYEY